MEGLSLAAIARRLRVSEEAPCERGGCETVDGEVRGGVRSEEAGEEEGEVHRPARRDQGEEEREDGVRLRLSGPHEEGGVVGQVLQVGGNHHDHGHGEARSGGVQGEADLRRGPCLMVCMRVRMAPGRVGATDLQHRELHGEMVLDVQEQDQEVLQQLRDQG